jgi:hypothetical protein
LKVDACANPAYKLNSSIKELNPRPRVYVEIPKPSRVELKCSQNLRGFGIST